MNTMILTLPDLGFCGVNLGSLLLLGDEYRPKKRAVEVAGKSKIADDKYPSLQLEHFPSTSLTFIFHTAHPELTSRQNNRS